MNTNVRFYAVLFVDKKTNEPVNFSFYDFLIKLDNLMEENVSYIKKDIEGKYIRCFKSKTVGGGLKRIVIPIGKRKDSASYTEDEKSKSIREIDYNIFDVNLIYYDENKRAFIMTNTPSAPRYRIVEEYFNRFIHNYDYKLAIIPMYYSQNLQQIRKAQKVRSIVITVDLGNDIDSGFTSNFNSIPVLNAIRKISHDTKEELNGNKLKLELLLDDRHKNATMDVKNILNLVDCLNLESDFIKEIELKYADSEEKRKLSDIKLKENSKHLEYNFISEKRIGVDELRLIGDEAFLHTANQWYSIIQKYNLRITPQLSIPDSLLKEEDKIGIIEKDKIISV